MNDTMKRPDIIADVKAIREIGEAIVHVSAALKEIESTRLTRRALVVLLVDQTGLGVKTIEKALNGMKALERTYLKPLEAGKEER